MRHLRGATAIVTGASRGIGPDICSALGRRGVKLALIARSESALRTIADGLSAKGISAVPISANLGEDSSLMQALTLATRKLERIDLLVNNAAIEVLGPFHKLQADQIDEIVRVNVRAPMRLTLGVMSEMLAARRGHIVNVASAAGPFGLPYQAVYAATKAALIAFTKSIREEYRGTGVSASAVIPTFILGTGMYQRGLERAGVREHAPLVLTSTPWQVARAVVRAIEYDLPEVAVNRIPLRPILATIGLLPGMAGWLLRALGVTESMRRASERRPS
jgi:short-subunit dehydrogenase